MELYIIRHGETLENAQNICQGQLDGTLSPKGIEEAKAVGKRIAEIPFSAIYTSDLGRAHHTAELIYSYHRGSASFYSDQRLRERYFGSFQGQPFPEDLATFVPPLETEMPEAIIERLSDFITEIRDRYRGKEEKVLLVSHGFTLKVLWCLLSNSPLTSLGSTTEIANTSLGIVDVTDEGYTIKMWNNTDHIKQEET
ncbi:MAG: histidine phosphatase family protein [Porphyromonas sp.]|nr:histidine phosphatase family protein [Porphyromonas sp.]